MSAEETSVNEMGPIGRIVGIFTSPRDTFKSIDQKPTWLVPFIIVVVVSILIQFLVMDIGIKDRIALEEARGTSEEQIEAIRTYADGPLVYLGVVMTPVGVLLFWAIFAGILLFGGNMVMGGETKFKKVFSVVAWSSLIGLVGNLLKTLLIMSKGTSQGVVTSLAILLPTPELAQKTILYRILEKFDLFLIWELILWIIGLAVINRFTTKKSATLVISLWVIYAVLTIALAGVLGPMFGG